MNNLTESNELISSLQFAKGIGPMRAKAFVTEGINTGLDLINYFPRAYIDRNVTNSIKSIIIQKLAQKNISYDDNFNDENKIDYKYFSAKKEYSLIATVTNKLIKQYSNRKKYLKLTIADSSGDKANVMYWNYADYYNKQFEVGDLINVIGSPDVKNKFEITFSQPEINKIDLEGDDIAENKIIPIYRSPEIFKRTGITNGTLIKIIRNLLDQNVFTPQETLPIEILKQFNLPSIEKAYPAIHSPENYEEIEAARKRFKFEEIFYFELFLALKHYGNKIIQQGIVIKEKSKLARKVYENLNFDLTKDQKKVINQITKDMSSGQPMNRLLQGDVGSGKTIVAALCMLSVIEKGYQVALMAPTAILAEQHYNSFKNLLKDSEINITLLTGGAKNKAKKNNIDKINYGASQIIIGTHTLFEDYMKFKELGLIVIDEQHRFGVEQKAKTINAAKKSNKGELTPHTLVMSATPIPRTLALTVYGDLDVSIIREMPAKRLPIRTKIVLDNNIEGAYQFIRDEVERGSQAYIVFPLVEKSDKLVELKSAIEYFDILKDSEFANYQCGLLHGQMNASEKEMIMKDFYQKKFDILIATTVIEVGIDVPNATVMLIQDAYKFGLSQLHQLRGRVGRGEKQSYCILATKDNHKYALNKKQKDEDEINASILRLKTMERTSDGFEIAEVDLKLRGPGDILGTKQSGLPDFKFLDLVNDGEIISMAKNLAFLIVEKDPKLSKRENEIYKKNIISKFRKAENYINIA